LFSCVANPDLAHSASRRIWNLISANSVDSFWADCRFRAEQGIRRGGIPANKIKVIYPGVDTQEFSPIGKKPSEKPFPVIGCLGNIRFIKGHQTLLEAIPAIVAKFPDALFYFIGSDFTGGKITSLATKLGVDRYVRFLGFQEDVRHHMRDFDIFLHPSFSEGLPRAILEAMSLEKTVIASNVGGIPEIITSGENGILVQPGDPGLLAAKTIELLRDPQLINQLGKQARITIQSKFRVDQMLSGFQKMYSTALEMI
jgi:glycosyltransferase involved in cell wall biosynthesis